MSRYLRTFICEDCGQPTTRKWQSGRALVCLDCGIDRARRWNYQLHVRAQLARSRASIRDDQRSGVAG